MTPLHLLITRFPQIRSLGWAIAGTVIPFSVFVLTTTASDRPRSPRPSLSSPASQSTPSAASSQTAAPAPPPRSPLSRLKDGLLDTVSQVATAGVNRTAIESDAPNASESSDTAFVNPFGLLLNASPHPPAAAESAPSTASAPSPAHDPAGTLPSIGQTASPATVTPGVPLTLEEAIALTVMHNTTVKNAYLNRIVDRAELRAARTDLDPKLTPILTTGLEDDETLSAGSRHETNLGAQVAWFAPTGGTLRLDWRTDLNSFEPTGDRRVGITYIQPLLRYGESTAARIAHRRALIEEDINLLELRSTLTDEITTTITTYRDLLLAQGRVHLTQVSLEDAWAQLQRQQAFVDAGRLARYELLRVEQNVAEFQSQLLEAQNAVQSAQLALMNQVGSDRNLNVVAVLEETSFDATTLALDPALIEQTSFAQRPDYLSQLLTLKLAEIAKGEAANDRRWNLDLRTAYNRVAQADPDWSATLTLTRELGDRHNIRAALKRAEVALAQQQNNLAQAAADIRVEVSDRIRAVRLQLERLELAKEQVYLVERELEAQEALQATDQGNSFELQDIQLQLLAARDQELTQRIAYLNALTRLEAVQGITLQRWGIRLDPER
ncbi:MAG: TolC family protein [Spirulinaceae cyanobacterium]